MEIKNKKHKFNETSFVKQDKTFVSKAFKESLFVLESISKVFNLLQTSTVNKLGVLEESDSILLEMEEMLCSVNIEPLVSLASTAQIAQCANSKKLKSSVMSLKEIMEYVKELVDLFLPITKSAREFLERAMNSSMFNLTCFIYFEFEINETAALLKAQEDTIEVDEIVFNHLQEREMEISDFLAKMSEYLNIYSGNISVFEEDEVLHETFAEYLLSNSNLTEEDFEPYEKLCTRADIEAVLGGLLKPQELLTKITFLSLQKG